MANAFTALADDSNAFNYNPASLTQILMPELSVTHLAYFADINYEYVGYVMPYHGEGFGIGVTWLNMPDFDSTGGVEAATGAGDYSGVLAWSLPFGPFLSLGVDGKFLYSQLAGYVSEGAAFDAAALLKPFGRNLSFAVVAENLGMETSYDTTSDPLPVEFKFAGAWRLYNKENENYFNLTCDTDKALDNRFEYNFGAELWLFDTLALRGGYVLSEGGDDLQSTPDAPANFTAGAGFKLGAANLDYAYVPVGELGVTNSFSISWKFNFTPESVDKDSVLLSEPKVSSLAGGQGAGVSFELDPGKALKGEPVRQWKVEILSDNNHLVRTLAGDGEPPKNLAWDLRDYHGNLVPRDQSYKFRVSLRDDNGHAVVTDGFIDHEIKPREMLASIPQYDTGSGALLFQPKSSVSIGVREWKLNIRDSNGLIIKSFSGQGAIPRTLAWKPTDLAGHNLAASKQVQSIQYDLEFKDASGASKVVSDHVHFATQRAEEESYHLPLPIKDFKVNRGKEILVASLPNLTAANTMEAASAPFVMPVLSEGVKQWKFVVSDVRGKTVRTFNGNGEPPENIFWDGRDENGLVVPEAEKAHFSFWVLSSAGKEIQTTDQKAIRNPFSVSGAQGQIRKISGLWFRFLDTDVQEAIVGRLREIAEIIRKNPNVQVTIQGHSWDEGNASEALRLSQERADSVLRFLIEEEDISPKNISSIGYGDSMPIIGGHDENADEHNRRVEVIIISK